MTCIFTVLTLISRCVFEEFATEGTSHDLIELLHYEFVAVDFMHFFFTLTNGALTTETTLKGTFPASFFDCTC